MVEQWLKIVKGETDGELKPNPNNPESSESSYTSESIDNPPPAAPPLSTVDPCALSEPVATTSRTILPSTSSFVIGDVDSQTSLNDNICIKESHPNETETNLNGWNSKMRQFFLHLILVLFYISFICMYLCIYLSRYQCDFCSIKFFKHFSIKVIVYIYSI